MNVSRKVDVLGMIRRNSLIRFSGIDNVYKYGLIVEFMGNTKMTTQVMNSSIKENYLFNFDFVGIFIKIMTHLGFDALRKQSVSGG